MMLAQDGNTSTQLEPIVIRAGSVENGARSEPRGYVAQDSASAQTLAASLLYSLSALNLHSGYLTETTNCGVPLGVGLNFDAYATTIFLPRALA